MLDDLGKGWRQSTNPDSRSLLLAMWDSMKELTESKEGANTTSLKGLAEI
jgi:hypothetical protein